MDDDFIWPSSNGYDLLEGYLTKLYGERGRFRHALEWYIFSDEFKSAARTPRSIEDIPECSIDMLKAQIERDEYWSTNCNEIINKHDEMQQANTLSDADYLDLASILGLYATFGKWDEVLLPYSIDFHNVSKQEAEQMERQAKQHPEIVALMVKTMLDGMRGGQIISYKDRFVLSQGYVRNFYRGENAYYGSTKAAMFRNMSKNPDEALIDRLISYMRMFEFAFWINSLSFIGKWRESFGDVYHGAIAQHYGIPTNGLDITSDLKVALFFACCHYEEGSWRPLKDSEFDSAAARADIALLGGDSRYGIIHCSPANIVNIATRAGIPELHLTEVSPIGYQPFARCSNQSGYFVEAGDSYDLFLDPTFAEWKFQLTPEICNWIFEEMDEGRSIYPNEPQAIKDIVDCIRYAKGYSERAFEYAIERLHNTTNCSFTNRQLLNELSSRGIKITPTVEVCSIEQREEIEREYERHMAEIAPDTTYVRWYGAI